MSGYVNFNANSLPPLNNDTGIFSRIKTAGSSLSMNTWLIIGSILLLIVVAIFVYYYYITPSKTNYHANYEQIPEGNGNKNAELLLFYADWCPHCKAAKPIWDDLKAEYDNKTINGYKVMFVEVDCTEESAEVEKLMNQYNVEGYPTVKLVKDGQVIEYDAKPTKETLTKFLNTVL